MLITLGEISWHLLHNIIYYVHGHTSVFFRYKSLILPINTINKIKYKGFSTVTTGCQNVYLFKMDQCLTGVIYIKSKIFLWIHIQGCSEVRNKIIICSTGDLKKIRELILKWNIYLQSFSCNLTQKFVASSFGCKPLVKLEHQIIH